uniref:Uncharacterized protein n=1 Tax=Wuchereria bancrofti TaxID=6293 RepID=A0A1I8E8R8_WUCBA
MQLFNSKLVLDMRHISVWGNDDEINSNRLKERKNDKRRQPHPFSRAKIYWVERENKDWRCCLLEVVCKPTEWNHSSSAS